MGGAWVKWAGPGAERRGLSAGAGPAGPRLGSQGDWPLLSLWLLLSRTGGECVQVNSPGVCSGLGPSEGARPPCARPSVGMPQWTRTHTEAFGVYTRGICSPCLSHTPTWAHAHTLADTIPGLPRARHQASQEATGNSDPAWASQTRSGDCAGRARSRVGKRDGQWGGGVPTLPAWLCSPCGVSALKFPVEFSILWRNRGVGRGGRSSGLKTQPLAGPPAPAWTFSLLLEGVTSPVPSQGIFLTPPDLRPLPLFRPDHSAPTTPSR